jgi:hypothetical protein
MSYYICSCSLNVTFQRMCPTFQPSKLTIYFFHYLHTFLVYFNMLMASPHMTFVSLPTKYALDLKVVWCYLAIPRGEFIVFNSL